MSANAVTDDKAVHDLLDCLGDKLTKGNLSRASPAAASLKRTLDALLDVCEKDEDDKVKRSAKAARVVLDRKLGKPADEDALRGASGSMSRDRQNLKVLVDDLSTVAFRFEESRNKDFSMRAFDARMDAQKRLNEVVASVIPKTSARYKSAIDIVGEIESFGMEKARAFKERKQPDPAMEAWLKTLHARKDAQLFDRLAHLMFDKTN